MFEMYVDIVGESPRFTIEGTLKPRDKLEGGEAIELDAYDDAAYVGRTMEWDIF